MKRTKRIKNTLNILYKTEGQKPSRNPCIQMNSQVLSQSEQKIKSKLHTGGRTRTFPAALCFIWLPSQNDKPGASSSTLPVCVQFLSSSGASTASSPGAACAAATPTVRS